MGRLFSLLLTAGTGLGLVLCSTAAQAETLRGAVQNALSHHPSVEAALAGEQYSIEEQKEEKSGLFPQLSTSASGGRIFGDNATSRGLSVSRGQAYSWLWEGSASLTQPIFDGMETFNRMDAAQARRASAQYNVADVRETLALRAAQAYLGVLQATDMVAMIETYKRQADDYRNRIVDMVDQGAADAGEAAQAKTVGLLLDNRLAESRALLDSAYAAYHEAVGKLPDSGLEAPDDLRALLFNTPDEAMRHALENHPTVMAAVKEMEAAGYDADAERGTLLPDLNGELSYLKRDQVEEIGGEATDARALLRLSWDFATGGGDLARVRKTKAAYSQKLAQSREKLREVEKDIRLAYAELERTETQKALAADRVRIAGELFDANEAQFEGARIRLLQLMQADNQLFGAKLEKINADYGQIMAVYTVLASTGRLTAALMGQAAPAAAGDVVLPDAPPVEPKKADEAILRQGVMKEPHAAVVPVAEPEPAVVDEDQSAVDEEPMPTDAAPIEAEEPAVMEQEEFSGMPEEDVSAEQPPAPVVDAAPAVPEPEAEDAPAEDMPSDVAPEAGGDAVYETFGNDPVFRDPGLPDGVSVDDLPDDEDDAYIVYPEEVLRP